ncbi:hypothetical protein ANN_03729 [Periplaneta americana]|uniref:Uncharacterized protein n=1 Tax=Periplaneta americana TaxID=6978 RepID=A0ABQ8U1P8_PERAM|nr:hypothetical protein ANN_03729 [Periplaneta americana]
MQLRPSSARSVGKYTWEPMEHSDVYTLDGSSDVSLYLFQGVCIFLYTICFKRPHKNQSGLVRSGDFGGHSPVDVIVAKKNSLSVVMVVPAVSKVIPSPNPQAGGPPLIGCPRLLIQYIRSYPPYLEAVSSIRNLRTRHAVVIGTHNMGGRVAQLVEQLATDWKVRGRSNKPHARISTDTVNALFPGRVISRKGDIAWPPRSPDLTVCDFFLKTKVFGGNPPRMIPALKQRIREEVAAIPVNVLRGDMQQFVARLEECVRFNGEGLDLKRLTDKRGASHHGACQAHQGAMQTNGDKCQGGRKVVSFITHLCSSGDLHRQKFDAVYAGTTCRQRTRGSTGSYPAFARIGLRENPGKNLNQITCPDLDSNPGHLVSRPDALTVTPQAHLGCAVSIKRLRNTALDQEYVTQTLVEHSVLGAHSGNGPGCGHLPLTRLCRLQPTAVEGELMWECCDHHYSVHYNAQVQKASSSSLQDLAWLISDKEDK